MIFFFTIVNIYAQLFDYSYFKIWPTRSDNRVKPLQFYLSFVQECFKCYDLICLITNLPYVFIWYIDPISVFESKQIFFKVKKFETT